MSEAKPSTTSVADKRNAQGRSGDRQLPPGPRRYTLLKLSEFQHQPIEYLGHLWREYGDLVRLSLA